MSTPVSLPDLDIEEVLVAAPLEPWELVVWDDPVNLMSYVVRVFRRYFGFSEERATALMLTVHHEGQAVVATGPRETMEVHAQAMHDFGLWATIRQVQS
ncbi:MULTISPECIES: ATP-dependent Clp protease adapter ClpS [unclassified Microbacterium]|uniref:ATP-dependent Clp protease adapter ClpS n=1 Tax=unclassified Microbacterium TaxID=2609290 RepID=UPI0012F71CCF|nr:ATP-dependent Clp protease adapter ClpS [Microbacterium sp. MAH-37]MVQ42393.1 ATP-dependent Clp protease adapter ClpS [Microbacterium sp. MAH-37]